MIVEEYIGDMFTSKNKIFGHGVNCEKNMNSGLAAYIRVKYPEVYEEYLTMDFVGGDIQPVQAHDKNIIINIASQIKSGRNARLDLLEEGVRKSFEFVQLFEPSMEYNTLVLPQIGCGVGGLEWEEVREVIIGIKNDFPKVNLELWTFPE